jgi:cytochrome c556
MKKIKGIARLMAGVVFMGTSVAVVGHGGATGVVADRMMGMMMLAEQVKLLSPLLERNGQVETDIVIAAAEMISVHAGESMTELFPEGSLDVPSVARPEIWQRWEQFAGFSTRLAELGDELAAAAESDYADLAVSAAPVEKRQLGEWDQMSFATLMGLPSKPATEQASIDTLIAASEEFADPVVPARATGQIVADITATCSSCHAVFRR